MNKDKFWHEVIKEPLIKFLEDKEKELEAKGYIPTLKVLIEELKNE